VQRAYQAGSGFVQRVIEKVGRRSDGRPRSNIIVTSDHGFAPFHTAVSMSNILVNAGLPAAQVRAVTSGPAANLYINLQNRGPDGTVNPETYIALQAKILDVLRKLIDTNPNYTFRRRSVPVFSKVYARPLPADLSDPTLGRRTSTFVGRDFGDVFALLNVGYNFDGTQSPVVPRLGDSVTNNPPLSVPNFYGAHGYDPELPEMSASFYAAGPDIRPNSRGIGTIRTIDIAPTVARILGVTPSSTVQGEALDLGRAPLQLLSAVSRKKHGAAGEFDIPLPLNGSFGIECRKPEGRNSHTLVFTFSNPIIAGTVQLTTGNASVKPALEGNTLIVKLVDVPDRQVLNLTLRDVSDGRTTLAPINVALGMLLGDVTADRMVNAGDLNEVSAGAAQNSAPDASSFRADLRTNGRTSRADVSLCEENVGHSL
jgi:hypothetical protein